MTNPRPHDAPGASPSRELPGPALAPQAGLSLVDVIVAMGFLAVVISTAMGVMVTSLQLDAINRETSLATTAAQDVVESMEGSDFSQVFALFNAVSGDDPGGTPAPGSTFEVSGLALGEGGAPAVGAVVFPVDPLAPGILREDVVMPELGLPMDLNGDGQIDSADHSNDYVVLPVTIRVAWQGASGERTVQIHSLMKE